MKRLSIAFIAVVVLVFFFSLFVGWLVSKPVQVSVGAPPDDLSIKKVSLKSASGAVVHGWLADIAEPKGSVILLPGVRANRRSMLGRARMFHRAGYRVLLVDLQGTGETKGRMITFGWRERLDVIAGVGFLRQTAPSKIAIVGTSLGGAAALFASRELNVDALVLESVYPTVEQATKNRLRLYLGRVGPLGAPLLLLQLRPRLGVRANDLRPIDYLEYVRCPVFIIGGAEDRHTTRAETISMYRAAQPPKSLWIVPRASHVDLYRFAPDEYERQVLRFLSDSLR